MTDYIKREDAVKALRTIKNCVKLFEDSIEDVAVTLNDLAQSADVVERKVGRWVPSTVVFPVKNTDGTFSNFGTLVCSSCDKPVALVKWNNYCPNCGAKMEV